MFSNKCLFFVATCDYYDVMREYADRDYVHDEDITIIAKAVQGNPDLVRPDGEGWVLETTEVNTEPHPEATITLNGVTFAIYIYGTGLELVEFSYIGRDGSSQPLTVMQIFQVCK